MSNERGDDDNDNQRDGELDSSKLGTLEYWEQAYEQELANFNEFGDEGEIWFGVHTLKRVLKWMREANVARDSHIIDIGCGNGYTCLQLAQQGFSNLFGVDYSPKAVDLATSICERDNIQARFQVMDVLNREEWTPWLGKFAVAYDKGTYDAIGLSPDQPKHKRRVYKEFVKHVLAKDGLFIITSCNWTLDELVAFFTTNQNDNDDDDQIGRERSTCANVDDMPRSLLTFVEEIKNESGSFTFGGARGATTSTAVFKHTPCNDEH